MRNKPVDLTPADNALAYARKGVLKARMGETVSLTYRKRDGSLSTSTGVVTAFNGTDGTDTMSVVVECPDKGRRTINLARINTIR